MTRLEKVLIIDPDETSCFLTTQVLKKARAIKQVISNQEPYQALETLKKLSLHDQNPPEIILMENHLYPMDAFDFLTILSKQKLNFTDTKVFILSNTFQHQTRAAACSIAFSGFITKPLPQEKSAFLFSDV